MSGGLIPLAEDRPRNADLFVRVPRMNGAKDEVVVARDDRRRCGASGPTSGPRSCPS